MPLSAPPLHPSTNLADFADRDISGQSVESVDGGERRRLLIPFSIAFKNRARRGGPLTVPYLGPGWGRKALEVMRSDPRVQEALRGVKLRLLTRITDAPAGRYGYLWADFDGEGLADARMGHAGDGILETLEPTVTLEGTYAVFAAIQRGELTERKAFLSGQLKVGGSRVQALRHMGALEAVTGALAEIPCQT